jgi:hypothetical protein
MQMVTRKVVVAAGLAIALAGAGAAIAIGTDDQVGSDDHPVSGKVADDARAAALRYTHGGTAGIVERDTEHGSSWDIEVTRDDGSHMDVRLDADLKLVEITSDEDD